MIMINIRKDQAPLHCDYQARQIARVFVTYKKSSETQKRSLRPKYATRLLATPPLSKIQGKKLCSCKSLF